MTNEAIQLRWTDALPSQTGGVGVSITNFIIQFKQGSGAYTTLISPNIGTNAYLHTGLTGGEVYTYQIKAVNKYGASLTFSTETAFQTG